MEEWKEGRKNERQEITEVLITATISAEEECLRRSQFRTAVPFLSTVSHFSLSLRTPRPSTSNKKLFLHLTPLNIRTDEKSPTENQDLEPNLFYFILFPSSPRGRRLFYIYWMN
jgi:hypothetical protein